MKRLPPVLGALVLVGAVVAVVVWQRPEAAPPPPAPPKDFVLRYADGSPLWSSKDGDPKSPLAQQVLTELRLNASLDHDDLRRAGATVVTTIDQKAQAAGKSVIETVAPAQPGTLRYSLTAVDPATGGVLVYLPGTTRDDQTDYAGGVLKEPGSAFFPINVVAALQKGQTLDSAYDGRSPRRFPVIGDAVRNKDNQQCGERCTVREALAMPSNVVMYDMVVIQVGLQHVVTAGRQAGVPEAVVIDGEEKKLLVGPNGAGPIVDLALGGDQAVMRPLDLTTVYATFAAGGVHHKTHFVSKVTNEGGDLLYQATETATPAFDPDGAKSKAIAAQVTGVLKDNTLCPNAVCRASEYELNPKIVSVGRPGQNGHAWTVGYTDRMAITVLVDNPEPLKPTTDVTVPEPPQPVKDSTGAVIEGAGLPKDIWQRFVAGV